MRYKEEHISVLFLLRKCKEDIMKMLKECKKTVTLLR